MKHGVCFDVDALPQGGVNQWARKFGRFASARESDRMAKAIKVAAIAERLAPIPGPVHVALTFYWPDRRRRDPDNGAKHVLDGIVDAGLIEDDGPPVLVSLTLAARYDSKRPRTEVRITAADAPAWEKAAKKGRSRTIAA